MTFRSASHRKFTNKLLKSTEFVESFSGGCWIWGPFWEQLVAQNRKKGDPETLAKNDGKKVMRDFPRNFLVYFPKGRHV